MRANANRVKQLMKDFVTSGMHDDSDVEIMRKVVMLNIVCLIGVMNLFPLGILAIVQGNLPLGFFDLIVAAVLIGNVLYLRTSRRYTLVSYVGVSFAAALFLYLFVTGGQNKTGHLWYYTFPLFTSFLLGSKRGAIASLIMLSPVILLFATGNISPHLAMYETDFKIRFIPSFLVVLGYSYAFENIREKTQHKLTLKNAELRESVTALEKAQDALTASRDGLEQRVTERTAALTKTNEQLRREVEERKRAEDRLGRINSCFLSFGANPTKNIGSLTTLSGELLEATCALYNRLEGDLLCSTGQWNTPPDFKPRDKADGHICFDVIQKAGDEVLVIRDLPNTAYAKTDPNVTTYNLRTYLGKTVKSNDEVVGSHCVVFQSDIAPTEQDRKVVEIAASAIGVEEERLSALTALEESEERYRSFVDNVDLGVTLIDADHNIAMINGAHGKMFNKPVGEFLGKKCFREFRKLEAVCPDCPGVKAMSTGQPATTETTGMRDDGTDFSAKVHAFPTFGQDNTITGFIEVVEDVTEHKRLEAQLQQTQKLEAIGTLAGGITHDFNNLLMGIQGNVSLLLFDKDDIHPDYERLRNIEKQIQSGARLTSHLLGYARGGRYEVKPVALNQVVEETSHTFGRTRKAITIHRELAEDLFAIEADPGQIEQVLWNVYINAADAMPKGGDLFLKTVNVTHKDMKGKLYQSKPGNYVLLTSTDTGTGMDLKTMKRIFDPFFTTKEMGRGTGLGLASAYGIIKAHGGYIDVDSKKMEGATFSIYLPASGKKVQKVVEAAGRSMEGTGTVLLVDDEEVILRVGQDLLEAMGYQVLLARNGKEAIEVYGKNQDTIDIVVLDMVMPNMGGGEAYDGMKKINPDIKVLLSSGYSIEGEATEILDRGCNGFIHKPFTMQDLSKKIGEILEEE